MSAGHTLGPWKARFEKVRYVIFVDGEVGEKALATTGGAYPDSAANARLIAAAPALLDACELLIAASADACPEDQFRKAVDASLAAIALAKGERA